MTADARRQLKGLLVTSPEPPRARWPAAPPKPSTLVRSAPWLTRAVAGGLYRLLERQAAPSPV